MITTKARKGFTLIELIVVIAILAVLTTAAIVSYTAFIRTAEKTNAQTLAAQLNIALKTDLKKHADMAAAVSALNDAEIDFFELTSEEDKFLFAYDATEDEFVPLDEDAKRFSGEEISGAGIWLAADNKEEAEKYGKICSVYLTKNYAAEGEISLSYGYDAGETGGEAVVNIKNDGDEDIICRSGGDEKITVNAPNATIYYYGNAENIASCSAKEVIYNSGNSDANDEKDDNAGDNTSDNTDDDPDEPTTQTALYTRCDGNGAKDDNGEYILFGRYPQKDVTETEGALLTKNYAGNLPVKGESANASWWKSYCFYANGEVSHYAWYKDVDSDGDGIYDYRGVYFIYYRPCYTANDCPDVESARQYSFGYETEKIYWFKYEPILWKISSESDGEFTLVCENIISCGQYSANSANDYSESDICSFLEGNFLSFAFTSDEKEIIAEEGGTTAAYLLTKNTALSFSKDEQKKEVTSYAKCIGVYADGDDLGYWWTETTANSSTAYCITNGSGEYANAMNYIEVGIAPAIKITATE